MVASFQYIEQVIATYQAATAANGNTPGRTGSVVVLDAAAGDDVMITGDLHGHRRNFNALKKIADLAHHPRRHLILQEVCHGGPTYPGSAACMSHGMLEDIAKLKVQYPDRVHFLLGNHELAELTDYPILKAKKMLNLMFRLGMQEMYGAAADKVRDAYLPFLRSCPLAVRLPGGVLVCHSTPENVDTRGFDAGVFNRELEPLDLMEHSDVFRLLWGRDYRPANAEAFAKLAGAKVLINGHEPCREGFQVPNETQIILDCCGEKACYVLLAMNREWTHAQVVEQIRTL
jgi:hypothetical protein